MMQRLQFLYTRYIFLVCCLSSIFFTACGIESFVYLEKPQRSAHDPTNRDDVSAKYCEFTTADAWNTANATGYFQGTEIYYRIYEHESDCTSDRAAVSRYNENNPSSVAQYLQDTKKYNRLTTSNFTRRPLIGSSSSNITVRFRLQDYGGTTDPAQLVAGGSSLGIPYRGNNISSDRRRFDRQNITTTDEDVQKASSSSTDAFWWINFYAVSYGYDTAFKSLYSSLEPLGSIKLEKNP